MDFYIGWGRAALLRLKNWLQTKKGTQTNRLMDDPSGGQTSLVNYYLSKKNCPTLCKSPFIDQDNTIWLLRWWLVFCMASPRGYHCRHAPRHAFVEIFEVLWSDGPPDLLCDFFFSEWTFTTFPLRPSVQWYLFYCNCIYMFCLAVMLHEPSSCD